MNLGDNENYNDNEEFQDPNSPLHVNEFNEEDGEDLTMMEFTMLIQTITNFYYKEPQQFIDGDEWKAKHHAYSQNGSASESVPDNIRSEVEKAFMYQLKKFQTED